MCDTSIAGDQQRIAWLLPDMGTGGISFQHILAEFTKHCPETIVFTGQWPGYAAGFEGAFQVREVGATKHLHLFQGANGYGIGFSLASPSIIQHLLKFKPQVIFANAFSMWTGLALLLKPLGGWKVVIVYEGGSPTYEGQTPSLRLLTRRRMVLLADAFVANSQAGKAYLTRVLGADADRVFCRPFLVPSVQALLQCPEAETPNFEPDIQRPVFLYVGQIIPRKGLKLLLEACVLLKQQGYENYTLMVVGDGEQRPELEAFAQTSGLENQVQWIGKVPYRCLGSYFQFADVFVFPTYEDIWGMVLTEAMAFGKPVICSKGAGAVEIVNHSENGLVFDPKSHQELAEYMRRFINNPSLSEPMGQKSAQIMSKNTPQNATKSFLEVVKMVHSR
jgi:glycosyltransferase involved in cell wall biosynthesis